MNKSSLFALALLSFAAPLSAQPPLSIGGEKLITLTRKPVSQSKPEFTSITLMPGRGMELLSITANFPGKGVVQVLSDPGTAAAEQALDHDDSATGNAGYSFGAAFLVPYPNRIRGKLSPDGKTVTVAWQRHSLTLPANNVGKNPGAERHAMHGLILRSRATDLHISRMPGGEQATAVIHAGDFGGHWISKTDLVFTISLTADAVDATIVAHNIGNQAEPMAIGWHPYFNLPSGQREQVRIHIPASQMAQVDNYDNVFPTGKLRPVAGTRFDMRAPDGRALGKNYYDDNWSRLYWKNGAVTIKIIDPAAHYGVAIQGLSPQIKTLQMYAPPGKSFVAIEDQDNFADPFGKEWHGMDTGMVTLQPDQSTKWHVRLQVFVP